MTQLTATARREALDHPLVAIVISVAVLAVGAIAMLALAAGMTAAFHDDTTACNDIPSGYQCSVLLNKGTGAQVGEVFVKKVGDDIKLVTNLFGRPDTGHDGEKLCLDDDATPWSSNTSCLGGTAAIKFQNAGYTLATPGDPPPNNEGNKYEYMLEGNALGAETTTCFSAAGAEVACDGSQAAGPFATYQAFVDGYEFYSFHFNQSLSIESFFQIEPNTELEIDKTPDAGTIDIGDKVVFDITVSDVTDGVDAINASITDDLPGDRDWEITAQDGTACAITADDPAPDDFLDDLSCTFATLADGADYSLTVSTTAAVTETDCNATFSNRAFAEADNASQVFDDGAVTVQCTTLTIAKTPDSGTVTVGDKVTFGITVTDGTDGIDAINASITDDLPGDRDWEITAQDGTACAITADDPAPDDFLDDLSCTFATLADGTDYSLTVATVDVVTTDECGDVITNTANADADNAAPDSDDGDVTVICGAIEVTKVVKDATTTTVGDTKALAGVGFTLFDASDVAVTAEVVTDSNGIACFDGLPLDTEFTLRETTTPTGYLTVDDQLVTSSATGADCGSVGTPTAVEVENTPLTDLDVLVTPQADDATFSRVICYAPGDNGTFDNGGGDDVILVDTGLVEAPVVDEDDLVPGEYRCDITIDP